MNQKGSDEPQAQAQAQPKPKKWIRAKEAEPHVFVLSSREQGNGFGNVCYPPYERSYDRAKEGARWYDRIDAEQDARRRIETLSGPIPTEYTGPLPTSSLEAILPPELQPQDSIIESLQLPEDFEHIPRKKKGKR